jgi:hypothetical protein
MERGLAAKDREKPEYQGQSNAQEQAGNDGKIKCSVFTAMNNVPRQTPQTQRQTPGEIQKRPNNQRNPAEK